jgi:hypothetical protein
LQRNNREEVNILSRNQKDLILKVIMRLLDPQLLESNLLYVGNLTAQYFYHLSRKVEVSVLEAIVKRLYKVFHI